MTFRVSIALSKNQVGPGMTPIKKKVLEGLDKDTAKASYKAAIEACFQMDGFQGDTSGEVFVLHGRVKVTEDGKPWFTMTAEWPNVDMAAATELGNKLEAQLSALTGGVGVAQGAAPAPVAAAPDEPPTA